MTSPNDAKAAGLRFVARMRWFEGERFGILVEGGIVGDEGAGEPMADSGER